MLTPYKSRILQHIRHPEYRPRQLRKLAEELGITPEDYPDFRQAVDQLVRAGQAVMGASDTLTLPPMGGEVVGRLRLHERGFAFLIPETLNSHGDLFIPAGRTGGALTGDRVRADVRHRKGRTGSGHSPYVGEVVEVLQRAHSHFVGVLDKRGKVYVVHVDGKLLHEPVIVRDVGAKNARPGQKVVIELTHYPEDGCNAEGVITEVLGESGEPAVETQAVCRAFGLELEFPVEAVEEARAQVRAYDKHPQRYTKDRVDLAETYTLTIDPPDARDFDDAISIERTDKGWELGVHIADVAAFVKPGGALDAVARERGNSVYLPQRVIPMLPEVLSNGICSLQEAVPRLAKSAFITYDEQGHVQSRRYASTVIHSNHRLTYLEAQALIDGNPDEARKHARSETEYDDELVAALQRMDMLARVIRKRRFKQGMIVLDLPEVELIYDDNGNVTDAAPEDDAFTHRVIEMFMVEANEAVAQLFADCNVPLLRRVHPDPAAPDMDELRQFARVAGYNIPANPTRKQLQTLLDAVRDKPAARAVHLAVLKTLTQAAYSPALLGHFALASEHYAHFTSPIRRYPDLTVHRQLQAAFDLLDGKPMPRSAKRRKPFGRDLAEDPRCAPAEELEALGNHCSSTERNAEQAERELRNVLVMKLMQSHVGDTFPGTCTGVTSFGAFIQIDKYLVEGLIRTGELPGAPAEHWRLNSDLGCLVAQRSGKRIALGDTFPVRIEKVDVARREMDLRIVGETRSVQGKPHKQPKSKPKHSNRRNVKNTRDRRKRRGRR